MHAFPKYVLVTPARNEAQFIELTLQSMVAQTVRPIKWVIVSDGSTDGTDEIVSRYAADHPWIELVRMPARRERNFAGKVYAFNAGYAQIKNLAEYEVIGSLDGDISFDEGYFAFLLEKLAKITHWGLWERLSKRVQIRPMTTGLSTLSTYRAPANCSGGSALKRLADMCQLRGAALTTLQCLPPG